MKSYFIAQGTAWEICFINTLLPYCFNFIYCFNNKKFQSEQVNHFNFYLLNFQIYGLGQKILVVAKCPLICFCYS